MLVLAGLLLATAQSCDGTTRDVETCLGREIERSDAELNRYYAAAVKRLTDTGQTAALARLRASERAWIRYRNAECDAVWEYWSKGSIRGTFSADCRIRLTRDRTMAIWRNWLTYVDSTPPLLPRPGKPE